MSLGDPPAAHELDPVERMSGDELAALQLERLGPHIWEDHFYPETVDPHSGAQAQAGELVLTTLTKQAQPVVRYRTRDLTRLLPGTARPAFRRMEKVTGRTDDMIIVRGMNVFPTRIEEVVLRTPGLSPHFQVHLTRPGRLDVMTVKVEARPGFAARAEAGSALRRAVKDATGVSVGVEVVDPETLERSVGKLRRVIDKRDN